MFTNATVAPRGQVTARNDPGRSPPPPSRPVILFEPRTRLWLHGAINGLLGQDALEDRGDHRKGSGEVPGPPCGADARPPGPISPHNLI